MTLFSFELNNKRIKALGMLRPTCALILGLIIAPTTLGSEDPSSQYSAAVRKAVLENPQVNLEWHRFDATQEAQRAAKGALLPEVNLNANAGREQRSTPQTAFDPYNAQSGTLTVRQLLFDGFTALETTRERKFERTRSTSNSGILLSKWAWKLRTLISIPTGTNNSLSTPLITSSNTVKSS